MILRSTNSSEREPISAEGRAVGGKRLSIYALIAKFSSNCTLNLGGMGTLHYKPDQTAEGLRQTLSEYFGREAKEPEWVERMMKAIQEKYSGVQCPKAGIYLGSTDLIEIMVATAPTDME